MTFLGVSQALLVIATLALLVYAIIVGDAFLAALAGFMLGINASAGVRDLYAFVWRLRQRG